ncbi:hypothetical protein FRC11_009686, partial [Ceratobasidium sp. 423]
VLSELCRITTYLLTREISPLVESLPLPTRATRLAYHPFALARASLVNCQSPPLQRLVYEGWFLQGSDGGDEQGESATTPPSLSTTEPPDPDSSMSAWLWRRPEEAEIAAGSGSRTRWYAEGLSPDFTLAAAGLDC